MLEELHSSGKSVEQVAAQAPWPRWMVWGGWCAIAHPSNSPPSTPAHASPYGAHAPRPVHPRYSTHYVLHFESGHYMIAGGGNQPSTHSVPYLPFRYQMLPWFLSAVERGRDGAQLAGMFERDADDEGAARGREMPPP